MKRARATKRRGTGPRPVDVHVGARVRLWRTLLGLSQGKLGDALGLTFQQVQKYERGANRIGSSRLFELSQILDVPVSFFFDDMPDETKDKPSRRVSGLRDRSQAVFESDALSRRETLELVRASHKIPDPRVRKRLFELTKSLADKPKKR